MNNTIRNIAAVTILAAAFSVPTVVGAQTVTPTDPQYPQRTDVPTLYINTTTGKDPQDKKIYVGCTVRLVDNGQMTTYVLTDGTGGIRGRGNSTWGATKKPWRLKFDKKVELLGKNYAKAKSWTLLANTFDKSLIRNALTRELGLFIDKNKADGDKMFWAAAVFVDLVMNGDYRGTYQISDQVEVRSKRVDIDENTGWLLEYGNAADKVDNPKISFTNGKDIYGEIQIKNPEFDNDDLETNPELADAIKKYMNDGFAKKMSLGTLGSRIDYDFINPRTGYRSMVDAQSLIDWYIASEITWNWDAFYSVYMHREADGPLHFGPLWDQDLSYGNHRQQLNNDYQDGVLLAFSNLSWEYRRFQPLVAHFFDDPWFVNAVYMRYNELLDDGLETCLTGKVDELATTVRSSATENFKKWDIWNVDGRQQYYEGWVNAHEGWNWDMYIADLRSFIPTRLNKIKAELEKQMENVQYVSETAENHAVAAHDQYVVMDRKAKAGMWNTLCLPFDVSKSRIEYVFGEGTKVQTFTSVTKDADGTAVLNFTPVNNIEAGTPYIIKPTLDVDVPFSLPWRVVYDEAPKTITHDGYSFTGIYAPTQLAEDGSQLFVGEGNMLFRPMTGSDKLKALRAFFTLPSDTARAKMSIFGETTDINGIYDNRTSNGTVYNINGTMAGDDLGTLPNGVYVIDGKKIIREK